MFYHLLKRPLFVTFFICLLFLITAGIFFNSSFLSTEAVCYIISSIVLYFCCSQQIYRYIALSVIFLFFVFFLLFSDSIFLLISEIILSCFIVWQRKNEEGIYVFLLLIIAFFLHLYYIQLTPIDTRQHDLPAILYYMQHIIKNGVNFINFDPWYSYYFFHQPLHFLILGYIYFLEIKIWVSAVLAAEGLQYVSLFYTTASMLVSCAILKLIFIKKEFFYSALIFFVFNPTLFLFSGYISDDAPLLLFSLLSLYYIISWQQTKRFRYILLSALFFSFGALTKLSILLFVPAFCLLLVAELFFPFNRTILNHICCFIIIAVPLSLIWVIRNHFLYDMPFYNIPDTSPAGQNFKYMSLGERILDFKELFSPFINAPTHVDANIGLAFIKTELFGEWHLAKPFSFAYIVALILYIFNILIHILTLFAAFFLLFTYKPKQNKFLSLFFVVLYFTVFFYGFKYALDYPYVCSSDYRLMAIALLPTYIILIKATPSSWQKYLLPLSFLYAGLSSIFYLLSI